MNIIPSLITPVNFFVLLKLNSDALDIGGKKYYDSFENKLKLKKIFNINIYIE